MLIKASAGGGGESMRAVDDAAGFADVVALARGEARFLFGDPRVLVERYLLRPGPSRSRCSPTTTESGALVRARLLGPATSAKGGRGGAGSGHDGQDKPVFVHRLITAGSIEEKMEVLKGRKQALAAGILGASGGKALSLTEGDIDLLFAPFGS